MEWDYIVVGAGSAGCAVAQQLILAGKRVLVLEAGGSDFSPHIKIPAAVWRIQPGHDWGYVCEPDPTRHGATEKWHRGRVLGGTSSINGMLYVRGAPDDFDRWAKLCDATGGWSAQELVPLFREIEHSDQPGPLRGQAGPLYVRTVKRPHAITELFLRAAYAAGYPPNSDYNGATQEGAGYLQFTQRRGFRWSSADAFLKPLRGRRNLRLLLRATVEKVETADGRAVAVVFQHQGQRHRESASDIVLSAGALNSPKLLMLSGMGDPVELRRHGIDVTLDLPGVGRHLKDHPLVQLTYRSRIPTYNLTQGLLQKFTIAAKYLRFREGPIAAAYEAAAFIRTQPSDPVPEIQVFFAPIGWGAVDGQARLMPYPAFKVVILRSHAASSGRLRLASADPAAPPVIESRLLEDESDIDCLVRGVQAVRNIVNTKPLADCVEAEVTPGQAVEGAQLLRDYIRRNAEPSCHVMGTCRMGLGVDSVVGPDLRVHGMENLWVADASVMPDAISANLNGPTIMMGTKLGKQLASRK
jgi:choline dehydrogenase